MALCHMDSAGWKALSPWIEVLKLRVGPITYLPGPLHLLVSLSPLRLVIAHVLRLVFALARWGWLRRSPRGTDLCEKVLFSCARRLRAPRSCLKLLDLLLCCCVHPCELAAWRKSISQLLVIGS
jgi:hypothetical protein